MPITTTSLGFWRLVYHQLIGYETSVIEAPGHTVSRREPTFFLLEKIAWERYDVSHNS